MATVPCSMRARAEFSSAAPALAPSAASSNHASLPSVRVEWPGRYRKLSTLVFDA